MESVAGTGMKGIGAGIGAVGTIAFGTIMGGAASSLAGGNFWQGAVSGMIVSTFNHVMHDGSNDDDGDPKPKPKSKSKFQARKEAVKPTAANLFAVEGNTVATIDILRDSSLGSFVRGGVPKIGSISNTLKYTGRALGVTSIVIEGYQYANGEISGLELGFDTGFAIVGMIPGFAPVALIYFGGKAIYEYSFDKTLFKKPN